MNPEKRHVVLLSCDWQVIKLGLTHSVEIVNFSMKKRTVYIRVDGRIGQKTLPPFTQAHCLIGECSEFAMRQSGNTRDVTVEPKPVDLKPVDRTA